MQYSAINIQGNIISGEILEKIRIEDIRYQTQADFGLDKNTTIRDEIGIAWAAARAHWTAFKLRRERLKKTDSGTSETRQSWMIPFLRELGYDLEKSTAEIINGKSYAISHRAVNRDGFPVHIVGINQSLDRRADVGGTRLSPHALIQEYLNNHEHLYALVTNGQFLRLLRDATRLSRLSYLEFDLERIMEEELFAEFALLYRLLHITRMPEKQEEGDESIIEFYHQEALDSGSRIREKLSEAVEQSLKELANGLLKHPQNDALRNEVLQGNMKPNTFYLYLLRLVYRVLFLLVIEERHLIYPEKRDEATNKKRSIYYKFYSINRLTRLAEKQIYVDPRKTDLWKSLLVTFKLFENNFYGEKLDIKPLGSGLFAPGALGTLGNQSLSNRILLKVLNLLVTFENENRQRVRVNYADLDVEEFGSVYEGLLEYDPAINEIDGQPVFSFVKGEGRSSSGSHYTPEELVKPLIKHSLDYIIEDRLKEPQKYISTQTQIGKRIFSPSQGEIPQSGRGVSHSKDENALRTAREAALLSISVADVACGSGHILLSAARRIALELARVRTGEDQPAPPALRKATRDVIRNCIYGVDLNPLAVELCKVALWLEAHNPGEPLNFLDHRIKCGNSIVGLAHKEELKNGIAEEAFKTLPGDEKEIAATYRNKNKAERKLADQTTLNFGGVVEEPLSGILEKLEAVNQMPETTPQEIDAKQTAYNILVSGPRWWKLKTLADMQVAQFFIPKTTANKERLVTDTAYREYLNGQKTMTDQAAAMATAKAQQKKYFHWFLEFPEIFEKDGFDCIVGNPPYKGGSKISTLLGNQIANYLHAYNESVWGMADLVTYFIRRYYEIQKKFKFFLNYYYR
jgi:type I restriction-modification system DNA methylase subunit